MGKGEKYDVVIIGAGIGGLVCGCYLAKAGLKVLIVEKNDKPGGYCSSFERDGYRFDVGLHYLGGIKNGILGKILEELDLKDRMRFYRIDPTDKIIIGDNVTYIRTNPYDTIREFKNTFPKEKAQIDKFFRFIMNENFLEVYKKTKRVSFRCILDEFFELKETQNFFEALIFGILGLKASEISALTTVVLFRQHILDPGYYPIGGAQSFVDGLIKLIREFKGEFLFSTEVSEIIIKKRKAKGVIFRDGRKVISKYVISNIDAKMTFKNLIKIKSKEAIKINKLLLSPSPFAVYIGGESSATAKQVGAKSGWYFSCNFSHHSKEDIVRGKEIKWLTWTFSSFAKDKNLKNNKKLSIGIFTGVHPTSKVFWKEYRDNFGKQIIKKIKNFIPQIRNIRLTLTAPPTTFYKYTFNRKGAAFGWASTPKQISISTFPFTTSIKGLFLVGQWVTIGTGQAGIPTVALTGRRVSKFIIERFEENKAKKSLFKKRLLP